MLLKQQIEDILQKESYTFAELAEYLRLDETVLEERLNNRTLELRYLEDISKVLRIPLYSFFRTEEHNLNFAEKPWFVNKLWSYRRKTRPEKLKEEIWLLKYALADKEAELEKWKRK